MARIIVPAHIDHIFRLANNMRRADIDEVAAATGKGPYRALFDSLASSVAAWTGLVGRIPDAGCRAQEPRYLAPVCMFGVAPTDILCGTGSPWLLGTDEVEKCAIAFLRLNKQYVAKMLDLFPRLVNYVDARNTQSIRWLKWLGFAVDPEPVPYGPLAMPFHRFELKKEEQGIRIKEVKGTDHIEDAWQLLCRHREELATHKDIMILKPDLGRYRELERSGSLITLALYDGGSIVGYSVTVLARNMHYSDLLCAQNDVLYVHPKYRKGILGLKLIRKTEQLAKERGARLMLFHGKENTAFSMLMPRLGYLVQDIVFSKEI